jgi:hypothetical protein
MARLHTQSVNTAVARSVLAKLSTVRTSDNLLSQHMRLHLLGILSVWIKTWIWSVWHRLDVEFKLVLYNHISSLSGVEL